MDKNIVILEGIIGDDYKTGKTSEGKQFVTFSLCINSMTKDMADSTERTHSQSFIRIFAYDKKLLEYLERVKARRGNRVSVFGRISSYKNEYRGISFISNNIICRDITIIKTKKKPKLNNDIEE